ncbi:MAG: hypothetical protein AN484_15500 [Aphanizomenon flos-aquae WA102]|uniref:Uncharacterized protein n=1 Tax=Aphanizomenon flos-aquae WA102 TaxID=1710896 RepID=A0A1B7X0I4_APHFL|nr:MAG: hypothetical protein AN484_15500 [Aphanizomenon flos-aquae WA102]
MPGLVGGTKKAPIAGSLVCLPCGGRLGRGEAVERGRATDSGTEEQRGGDVVVAGLFLTHEDLDGEAGVGVDSVGHLEARDFAHRESGGHGDRVSAATETGEALGVRREAVPLVDRGASEGADVARGQDASTEDGVTDDGSVAQEAVGEGRVQDERAGLGGLGGVEDTLRGHDFSVAEAGTDVRAGGVVARGDEGADFSQALFSEGVGGGRDEGV